MIRKFIIEIEDHDLQEDIKDDLDGNIKVGLEVGFGLSWKDIEVEEVG